MASTPLLALPRRTLASGTPGIRDSSRDGARPRRSKGRLVVELRPRPRDYLLSPGVPLELPQITPPRDTTAYIIERILLPSIEVSEHDGKPLPKRMMYIIGWRDLPAARKLVPAMDILDYVSPRELEDWECKLEQELDDAREKLVEEQKLEKEQEKTESTAKKAPLDPKTGKRKRGRPPAHTQIEPGATVDLEAEGETSTGRLKGGALSLSTPKKNRLKDFEGLSDDEGSPSRQIEEELYDYDMGVARYGPDDKIAETGAESEGGYTGDELPDAELPLEKEESEAWTSHGPLTSNETSAKQSPVPESTSNSQSTPDAASAWAAFGLRTSFAMSGKPPAVASVESTPTVKDLMSQKSLNQELLPSKQVEQPMTTAKQQKQKPARKKPKKDKAPEPPPVDENGEPVWVVKRLEDHGLFEVEGEAEIKRFFKVRWEGDWPEDQNPSWEPEENLPPTLVRNYLKSGKKRKKALSRAPEPPKQKAPKRKKLNQTTLPWMNSNQYGSVSEAFAGEDTVNDGMPEGGQIPVELGSGNGKINDLGLREDESDDRNERDELFVVDEDADPLSQPVADWNGTIGRVLGYG